MLKMADDELVNLIKEFINIDDKIKSTMADLKVVKERKNELSTKIMEKMKDTDVEQVTLGDDGAKLVVKESVSTEGITAKKMEAHLQTVLEKEQVDIIMKSMNDKREVKTKNVLSRKKGKTAKERKPSKAK